VYHVELRQFPHVVRRYNQSHEQVTALAVPWVKEEWVQVDDRKWNMNQAELTILEGPQLSMPELAMGRGWGAAQRKSKDITELVLSAFRPEAGGPPQRTAAQRGVAEPEPSAPSTAGAAEPQAVRGDLELLADSIGLEVLALLDEAPVPLLRAWRLAEARMPQGSSAQSLDLAEAAVRSLLSRRLIVLEAAAGDGGEQGAEARGEVAGEQIDAALRAAESWSGGEEEGAVLMRRA